MQWAPTPASGSSALDIPDSPDVLPSSLGALTLSHVSNGHVGNLSSRPQWNTRDPRTASTQSLVPSTEEGEGHVRKRKLLVVYIHGFMGNNSSFRSFPAHVHSLLKNLLGETHVIHTKIYPRYKTYKSIDVACENFSKWLAPHESPTTDVVLVGHSMGGLLAADVVLLPYNHNPSNAVPLFRHRILGTISLDAPLLGLHPGIVVSGIASLFRPAPNPPRPNEEAQSEYTKNSQSHTLSPDPSLYDEISPPSGTSSPALDPNAFSSAGVDSEPDAHDPYFNPPFPNDVAFVDRGWFRNIIHFATKHKEENLVYAAANHIVSHLEFGACLADYSGLKSRYNRLRRLEDVDNWSQPEEVRVRFVNYYTVSTGTIKNPRISSEFASPKDPNTLGETGESSREIGSLASDQQNLAEGDRVKTPRISIEDYSDGSGKASLEVLEPIPEPELGPIHEIEPEPESTIKSDLSESSVQHENDIRKTGPTSANDRALPEDDPSYQDQNLTPIPSVPSPPESPNLDALPDKESRKQAQKIYKAALKAYAQTVKARDRALKDRQKALGKRDRKAVKEAKKLEKQQAKLLHKPRPTEEKLGREDEERKQKDKEKTLRRRKFCMLPPKLRDGTGIGTPDPAWVEVYMEGVDEVGAHCGLFLPGPHYEPLVGDVGERIAGWVWEEASRRVALGERVAEET
ncbi:hypothetical protein C7999DRAFT_28421 [Corynascus novoguineensis]|uniref:DUF676 domain-containing protein n=1 Tax=Corynascus novoguineensis TaxID=1126955 RepID=A0AAN7HIB4_9PEZI|nr:hypothetical protein C7999DRAFT_28421 [Corynascus novoguineensis]